MRQLLTILVLLGLGTTSVEAQKNTKAAPAAAPKTVKLVASVIDPPSPIDSLRLYTYKGYGAIPMYSAARAENGTYTFQLPQGKPKIYGLGFSENSMARIVMGEEPEVKLWANAAFIDRARTLGSPHNATLENITKRTTAYQNGNWNDPNIVRERKDYVDSLKTANSPFWRSANVLMPPHMSSLDLNREAEHYGLHWFDHVDFAADRGYDDLPEVYYAFTAYAARVAGMTTEDMARQWADAQLARIPEQSGAYRLALGGLLRGYQQRHLQGTFVHFAKKYLDKYRNQDIGDIAALEYEYSKAGTSIPGVTAPDLAGMTPDSSDFALSKLRGKVVLVDFWASWCGPCRRENPAVRNLYAKYKDKGFEILGVSLDRDANAWRKAIADDRLEWQHISDLKGWQSGHAATYSVTSIPQTVLVDREGKLIVRNLRGESLAAKLAEIFGE
jgi:thiol-disulfide isomerase/thioredoxin